MRINFVLIDSENVQPEYIERLKHEHFRVIVFVGASQKRLNFPIVYAVQSLGSNGSYVQISSQGTNALDFHIAYYIGKLSAAHPDAHFHIISKDKGFDPLIKHLKDQKILCSRSASVLEIPLVKSTGKLPSTQRAAISYEKRIASSKARPARVMSLQSAILSQRAADFYEKRIASSKARPATVMSLQRAILSHFHKMLSGEEVAAVLEALTASGHVVVNGKKVAYPDRR